MLVIQGSQLAQATLQMEILRLALTRQLASVLMLRQGILRLASALRLERPPRTSTQLLVIHTHVPRRRLGSLRLLPGARQTVEILPPQVAPRTRLAIQPLASTLLRLGSLPLLQTARLGSPPPLQAPTMRLESLRRASTRRLVTQPLAETL